MPPTLCNRCGDAVEELECDPRDELAELDALLERLRLKRFDLKRKINRLHSPIVRLLPPDVTSTIFEFCLPDLADHKFPRFSTYTKEDLSIPLSLGAICIYWREIAWSTPSLWSSLVVRLPSRLDSDIVAGIAREWLARSGQLPLSIHISSRFYHESVSALADIINQYSARWSDIDLSMDQDCYKIFGTDNYAPILKSFRLHSKFNDYVINPNFQLICPRLERASLSFISAKEIMGFNIQWDNLTHLTLHSTSIKSLFLILRKTLRLVFCKVSGSCARSRNESVGAPLLTSLRSLQLIPRIAEYFFDNLIAPYLEEFRLPRYPISMGAITSFLRRSACSLRSFTVIYGSIVYRQNFMSFLQSIPTLNTLSLTNLHVGYTASEDCDPRHIFQLVAKVLSSQSTSLQQGFLPNLKILEFTGDLFLRPGNYCDLYPLPPADNVVHGPFHLFKLDLHPVTRIPKNMISYIPSLVERGVTVNVLSKSEDILQSSIDYYKCREDYLCRDWADNFESSLFS